MHALVFANIGATAASLAAGVKFVSWIVESCRSTVVKHAVNEHRVLELCLELLLSLTTFSKLLFVNHVLVHLKDLALLSSSNTLIKQLIKVSSGSTRLQVDSLLPSQMVSLVTHLITACNLNSYLFKLN